MKKKFLLLMLATSAYLLPAQTTVHQDWVSTFNGPQALSHQSLATGVKGNLYVTGTTRVMNNDVPEDHIATLGYDLNGVLLWATVDSIVNARASGLAVDEDNSVYITGTITEGFLTIKYDSSGVEQWRQIFDFGNVEESVTITLDHTGNYVLVSGNSDGAMVTIRYNAGTGFEHWFGTYQHYDSRVSSMAVDTSSNIYVTGGSIDEATDTSFYITIKYAGDSMQWATESPRTIGTKIATAIALDDSGNIFVTGSDKAIGEDADFHTIKYNSSGAPQWAVNYSGAGSANDSAVAIGIDADGNINVAGISVDGSDNSNFTTIQYTPSGTVNWTQSYAGPDDLNDRLSSMALDSVGNIYVTGSSESYAGQNDFATVKYDADGQLIWEIRYDDDINAEDYPLAMVLDRNANIYVSGYGEGVETGWDITTVKYSQPPPQVNAGEDQTISLGYGSTSVVLTATVLRDPGGYSFSWSNGATTQSITVSPTVTTIYTVSVEDSEGSGSDDVKVTVKNVQCGTGKVLICHNGKTKCVGTSAVANHLGHGDYLGECESESNTMAGPFAVETTSSPSTAFAIKARPNPFTESTTFELTIPKGKVVLEVYNVTGQKVATPFDSNAEIEGAKFTVIFDAGNLPKGIYFTRLISSQGTIINKLIHN